MSEYQYYEFQAIDRPLSRKEIEILRGCSTRARITPTSFINEYSYGSFKGDEDEWMAKYFDAFLCVANWGTRVLMLRLPAKLLSERTARAYCRKGSGSYEDTLTLRAVGGNVILKFCWEEEGGGEWIEGGGLLGSLMPIRSELAHGDLRALYLGWLRGIQDGDSEDSENEPPVPEGLKTLSPALVELVEFLEIDRDLITAAAEASADTETISPDRGAVARWVTNLPIAEKDALLCRLMEGNAAHLEIELRTRFERERSADRPKLALQPVRTVGQLLAAAEGAKQRREREETTKVAAEKARQNRECARVREEYLSSLATRVPAVWHQVEELVSAKQSKAYAEAIQLLIDLREVANRRGTGPDYARQLAGLRDRHTKKKSFLELLTAGGLE
jgi:hypothetical protein